MNIVSKKNCLSFLCFPSSKTERKNELDCVNTIEDSLDSFAAQVKKNSHLFLSHPVTKKWNFQKSIQIFSLSAAIANVVNCTSGLASSLFTSLKKIPKAGGLAIAGFGVVTGISSSVGAYKGIKLAKRMEDVWGQVKHTFSFVGGLLWSLFAVLGGAVRILDLHAMRTGKKVHEVALSVFKSLRTRFLFVYLLLGLVNQSIGLYHSLSFANRFQKAINRKEDPLANFLSEIVWTEEDREAVLANMEQVTGNNPVTVEEIANWINKEDKRFLCKHSDRKDLLTNAFIRKKKELVEKYQRAQASLNYLSTQLELTQEDRDRISFQTALLSQEELAKTPSIMEEDWALLSGEDLDFLELHQGVKGRNETLTYSLIQLKKQKKARFLREIGKAVFEKIDPILQAKRGLPERKITWFTHLSSKEAGIATSLCQLIGTSPLSIIKGQKSRLVSLAVTGTFFASVVIGLIGLGGPVVAAISLATALIPILQLPQKIKGFIELYRKDALSFGDKVVFMLGIGFLAISLVATFSCSIFLAEWVVTGILTGILTVFYGYSYLRSGKEVTE